jgi:hypothetical protein
MIQTHGGDAALLVFICSVTGAVALSYVIDGMKGNEMDPDREVPSPPYIGRGSRFTRRTIG